MKKYFGMIGCALMITGCAPAPAPDLAAAELAIRKADTAWVEAAKTRKAEAWVAFYTDDAIVLPPNEKVATTKEAMLKSIGGMMALPELTIAWEPAKVVIAQSGEIGYLYGNYTMSYKDDKGKLVKDEGKMVEIWKKQADGGWKCVTDIWNSDLPVAVN